MNIDLFDYHLPPERIAQHPLQERDASRLLVVSRTQKKMEDRYVKDLPALLQSGDLLVFNDTRVIPARLRATRSSTGGKVEVFLLPQTNVPKPDENPIRREVFTKSGGKLQSDETLELPEGLTVTLVDRLGEAGDVIEIPKTNSEFISFVQRHGEIPLPPYIKRPEGPSSEEDHQRYQTIFADEPGAVAAPTAGLHFTDGLLNTLKEKGIESAHVTLHVGPGTFRPVKTEKIEEHYIGPEPYFISEETAEAVTKAKREGRRVIPVGTTSLRVLESTWAVNKNELPAGRGQADIYIRPPFSFNVADALMTNFHLPKSSLLILAAAVAAPETTDGIELIQNAYRHALDGEYRFYSYGDACLITDREHI